MNQKKIFRNSAIQIVSIIACIILTGLPGCARMEQRGQHYDPQKCPFCIVKPSTCNGCDGTAKCTYCNGTGTRKTTTAGLTREDISTVTIEEKCPYCNATGICRYCEGSGKCWACKGDGHVEDWNFFERYRNEKLSQPLVGQAVVPHDSSKQIQ